MQSTVIEWHREKLECSSYYWKVQQRFGMPAYQMMFSSTRNNYRRVSSNANNFINANNFNWVKEQRLFSGLFGTS